MKATFMNESEVNQSMNQTSPFYLHFGVDNPIDGTSNANDIVSHVNNLIETSDESTHEIINTVSASLNLIENSGILKEIAIPFETRIAGCGSCSYAGGNGKWVRVKKHGGGWIDVCVQC